MKAYQRVCFSALTICFFVESALNGHGLAQGTLIKSPRSGWYLIERVCELSRKHKKPKVVSYNLQRHYAVDHRVKVSAESETSFHFRIGFDSQADHDIVCIPTQEFYKFLSGEWTPAHALKVGDILLNCHGILIAITYIEFIKKPLKVYTIEVEKTHNFFVGYHSVLTHNMVLPISLGLGLAGTFGSGASVGGSAASFFGPITFVGGIIVGGLIGIAIRMFSTDKHLLQYRLSFDANVIEECLKNNNKHNDVNNDAQAPGKPTEDDGFFPSKKWDGKKIKNPNGPGYGWPDKKGKVWVPTGPNGHSAPHWDVEAPDESYENVMPGGRIRGRK